MTQSPDIQPNRPPNVENTPQKLDLRQFLKPFVLENIASAAKVYLEKPSFTTEEPFDDWVTEAHRSLVLVLLMRDGENFVVPDPDEFAESVMQILENDEEIVDPSKLRAYIVLIARREQFQLNIDKVVKRMVTKSLASLRKEAETIVKESPDVYASIRPEELFREMAQSMGEQLLERSRDPFIVDLD